MTTRPKSVRIRHERAKRGSLFMGIAAATWLACGVVLVALTQAWWAWLFIAVGAIASAIFFVLLPRVRKSKAQVEQINAIERAQLAAAKAQLEARMRAFAKQPPVRSPFPSS